MYNDKFTVLLEDLSKQLSLTLKPDENNSCLLLIKDKLEVQIELDSTQTHLIIGSTLAELPPGNFRKDCLLAAMKANAKKYPRLGTFAYSEKRNALVIFEMLNLDYFTIENILSILTLFINKAMHWKIALDQGDSSPPEEDYLNPSSNIDYLGS